MITLGLVANVDTDGVYVTMPGSRGLLRGPYLTLQDVAVGDQVLAVTTDDGENVIVGLASAAAPRSTPATSTDNAVPRFDGTGGALQNSGVTISDSQQVAGVAELLIQAVGNPADGGGGSIRTAGGTYTMVFKPRSGDATYADGAEFYYDGSVPRWNCETNFWVEGRLVLRSGTDYGAEIGWGGPSITAGAGAPSHSAPNGSMYLRTDGTASTTLYVRAAGSWSALT